MAVRIHAAKTSEVLTFGAASLGAFAPLYLMMAPSAEETMARHTTRWAPRWEHVAQRYITPPVHHAVLTHIQPPAERAMQHVGRVAHPHMSRAAQHVDRRIRSGIERAQR